MYIATIRIHVKTWPSPTTKYFYLKLRSLPKLINMYVAKQDKCSVTFCYTTHIHMSYYG